MALTKHEEGSFRELWAISLPLMLSSLSLLLMIFVDRWLLAHYSIEAHNAAVNATTLGWAFILGWMTLAGISEVFVAQYNGSGEKGKLGEPVWQMIWLSFGSFLFFIPLSVWGTELIYEDPMKQDYFRWMVLFGPFFAAYGALTGFFIGRGKTLLITTLAIFANCVNACLDIALIFGVEGWIPEMGVKGAAIATSSSSVFQVIVLGILFLNRNSRTTFGTADYRLKWESMKKCLKIGLPSACFTTIEITGWALFYWMMTLAGETYITVTAICQNFIILFFFVSEGTQKAAITIAGNLIGAKKHHLIPKMLREGAKLHLGFLALLLGTVYFGHELIASQFLAEADPQLIGTIHNALITSLYLSSFYLFFEGIRFLLGGVLTGAGDTLFLLLSGSVMLWVGIVLPVYFIVLKWAAPLEIPQLICFTFSALTALIYLFRFRGGKWKALVLQ